MHCVPPTSSICPMPKCSVSVLRLVHINLMFFLSRSVDLFHRNLFCEIFARIHVQHRKCGFFYPEFRDIRSFASHFFLSLCFGFARRWNWIHSMSRSYERPIVFSKWRWQNAEHQYKSNIFFFFIRCSLAERHFHLSISLLLVARARASCTRSTNLIHNGEVRKKRRFCLFNIYWYRRQTNSKYAIHNAHLQSIPRRKTRRKQKKNEMEKTKRRKWIWSEVAVCHDHSSHKRAQAATRTRAEMLNFLIRRRIDDNGRWCALMYLFGWCVRCTWLRVFSEIFLYSSPFISSGFSRLLPVFFF